MPNLRIGMAQMKVDGGRPAENMERALEMVKKAAQNDCKMVVLPEGLDLGWAHTSAGDLAEEIPGLRSHTLADWARRYHIYLAAGLTERDGSKLYNAAVFYSSEGELLIKHRKINILTNVEGHFSVGNGLFVVDTPLGRIAMAICADLSLDSLTIGHALGRMGAELIISPAAWAVPPGHDQSKNPYGWDLWRPAYTRLASLYGLGVVGVSNVGVIEEGAWRSWRCIGCSLAVAPGGEVMGEGAYGQSAEELIIVDLPLQHRTDRGTETGIMLNKKGFELV